MLIDKKLKKKLFENEPYILQANQLIYCSLYLTRWQSKSKFQKIKFFECVAPLLQKNNIDQCMLEIIFVFEKTSNKKKIEQVCE